MTNDEIHAHVAIRHVMSVYNNSADHGRLDEFASCFTEDGELSWEGGGARGAQGLRDFVRSVLEVSHGGQRLTGGRHHLTTTRIELRDADHADGWSLFMVVRKGQIIQHGLYIDRFQRIDGKWLIAQRRVKLDYDG